YEHVRVERDLVIAAAPGVQAAARRAYALGQQLFDVHVYVFGVDLECDFAGFYVGEYALEALDDKIGVGFGYYALFAQHRRVRYRAEYVLPVQALVKRYRRVEVVDHAVGGLFKAAAP